MSSDLAAMREELADMDRQINMRFKAEYERDKWKRIAMDFVDAFELPGDDCEMEQAYIRACNALKEDEK